MSKVIAILCSDIHLSHKPPIARSAEESWYAAMQRPLDQLQALQDEHDCPVICAGDLFDKWNSPAELINFALAKLPKYEFYAIPGQHDLPLHNLDDIKKSSYWTLVMAGKVKHLEEIASLELLPGGKDLYLHPFAWGVPVVERNKDSLPGIHLAVVHSYIWMGNNKYPDAPESQRWKEYQKKLKGYDAAVFGDNHRGFLTPKQKIFNCGTFMRRKADEFNYEPQVGLLYSDGTITPHLLETLGDKFIDIDQALELVERGVDISDFIEELALLGDKAMNFIEALRRFVTTNKINDRVKNLILHAMEEGNASR